VNVREPRLANRGHRIITRGACSLGIVTASALWYMLSSVDKVQAILVPATLSFAVILGVILHTRTQARLRWQAAWERYSKLDVSRKSFKSVQEKRTFSLVGTN
jgi:hypothetical protein